MIMIGYVNVTTAWFKLGSVNITDPK